MRFAIYGLLVCVLGCGDAGGLLNVEAKCDGGGAGGKGGAETATMGGAGGEAPAACADWHYPPTGAQPYACPEQTERCADPHFGALSVAVCCPAGEPCSAPAPAATDCRPMLGSFLGWCCLSEC